MENKPVIFEKIYQLLDLATKINTYTVSIDEKIWAIKDVQTTWIWVWQIPDAWTLISKLDSLILSLEYSKDILEKIDTMVL